jgi:hypothetical protein
VDSFDPDQPELPLDHALLVAGAAISQASSATAVLAARIARRPQQSGSRDMVTDLVGLLATSAGAGASQAHGSFHPRVAKASAGKARSRLMKAGFTLAF